MFYTVAIAKLQPLFVDFLEMKKNCFIMFIATVMLLGTPLSGNAQEGKERWIDISSTVKREVTPDEIYLRITISESDYKGKKSLEEMQEAMLGVLKANRIDIAECLTLNYMGSEVSYTAFSKKIKPKTEATYMLKLYDAVIMQQVIASLEQRQISNIELTKVKYTKEKELKREMSVEAMQEALAEAKVLAGAIGEEIGKALTINSWMSDGLPQPRLYKSRANIAVEEDAIAGNTAMPQFSIGKITYTFNANVRFELK